MGLFEYLDRRSQRSHLRKLIAEMELDAQAWRITLFSKEVKTIDDKQQCMDRIDDAENKIYYYRNKLIALC